MEECLRRIHELDGLRAVAIALVLGCHYEGFSQLAWRFPEFGWIGVDLFFSLSGYLITTILLGLRGRATPYRTFYSRRLIRILPPYLAVLAVVSVFTAQRRPIGPKWWGRQLLFLQAFDGQQLRGVWDVLTHLRWHLEHLPSLLPSTPLPHQESGAPLVVFIIPFICWSLSIEEYFYLLWAPVVLRLPRKAIVCFGVAICLGEMMLRWMLASPDIYGGLPFRFDALLYGAFLAILLEHWRRSSTPRWSQACLSAIFGVASAGIAAILFVIPPVLGNDPRASPLVLAFGLPLLSIAFTALIGLLILRAETGWWLSRLLRTRIFQFIGTISYTMYLTHLIGAAVIRRLSGIQDEHHQSFLQAVLASALTIAIAQVSWIFLEKRVLRWKDTRFPNPPRPPEPHVPGLEWSQEAPVSKSSGSAMRNSSSRERHVA